jgi:hypothetical protein
MRIALTGVVGVLVLLSACGDGEEELAPTSPTPTAAPTATSNGTVAPTPTAPASVPADWPTFATADGLFTLRYPPSWFVEVPPHHLRAPEA